MKRKPKSARRSHIQLASIKMLALEIKRTSGFKHCIALNIAARQLGFQNYYQARSTASPMHQFPALAHRVVLDAARDFQPVAVLRRLASTSKRTSRNTGGTAEIMLKYIDIKLIHSSGKPGVIWNNHYYRQQP